MFRLWLLGDLFSFAVMFSVKPAFPNAVLENKVAPTYNFLLYIFLYQMY